LQDNGTKGNSIADRRGCHINIRSWEEAGHYEVIGVEQQKQKQKQKQLPRLQQLEN
jgi:hypothetical protein